MNEELMQCFEAVRDTVVAGMAHYQVWFALKGKGKAIEKYRDEMNDSRVVDFFRAANTAHYKMMFIEIACLFDSGDNSHSIRYLKNKMKESGLSDLSDKFDLHLQPFSELVSNIKTVRSKVIAHKDVAVDDSDLYKKHGIKPDDIKKLMDTAALLMRELEEYLTNGSSFHTVGPTSRWENATYRLLETLRAGRSS